MHRALAALVVALSAVPSAVSQSTLSEAEFLSAVGEDHPAFAALREEVGRARAQALAAAALDEPELGAVREDPAGATEQIEVTVAWQPPGPGRRLRVTAAEHGIAAAEARMQAERLALHVSLHEVYAEWALAKERAGRLADHAHRLAELARRERVRADRGESSGLEARRLALAAIEADSRLALAEAAVATAFAAAGGWAPELSGGARPVLPGLPSAPDALPEVHPRVAALEEDLAGARLSRRAADRILSWPELVAGWQREELETGSVDGPIFGLSWPVPLLDRKRAERSATATREQAAEARLETARRRLGAERAGALAAYRRLETAARQARQVVSRDPAMLAGAVVAFEHGEASVTDLLETLRSALQAELSALELHAATLAAFRRLEEVAGLPLHGEGRPNHEIDVQPTHGDSP